MIKTKVIEGAIEITDDVVCDCCGKSCKTFIGRSDLIEFEYLQLSTVWGYATKKDCQRWTAQLCEACVDEKLGFINFKKEEL